ncbi:MAG: hypothetical protein IKC93_03670, partial [Candidatus Methanomethylophilaceae archaeon]|nr:hypothetical protein [Candidatus Methanomethylophilaceae archaeon]
MGDSQREKLKVLFVATLLMLSSVLLAVLLPNQGAYSEESRGVAFDHQLITYYSNNGVDQSYSVEYDGIASSEYNPEYWAGTFDDVLGTSVQNWTGPKTDGTVNGNITIPYSIGKNTTYTLTFSDRDITIISCTSNNGTLNYDSDSISLQSWKNSSISGNLTITASLDITGLYDKVFSGWNTSPDGTGVQYYPGDVVPN